MGVCSAAMWQTISFLLLVSSVLAEDVANYEKDENHREMEKKASKTIMLTYDKKALSRSIGDIEEDVKKMCLDCQVTRLDAAGALIVNFKDVNHPPASDFKSIEGVSSAAEDSVVHIADDSNEQIEPQIGIGNIEL